MRLATNRVGLWEGEVRDVGRLHRLIGQALRVAHCAAKQKSRCTGVSLASWHNHTKKSQKERVQKRNKSFRHTEDALAD